MKDKVDRKILDLSFVSETLKDPLQKSIAVNYAHLVFFPLSLSLAPLLPTQCFQILNMIIWFGSIFRIIAYLGIIRICLSNEKLKDMKLD